MMIKEEADQKIWHKVLDDQRAKRMKEIYNENNQNQATNIVYSIKNTVKVVNIMPTSETPGKRFLKDLSKQHQAYAVHNRDLDKKIESIRVVFERSLRANPTSPTSHPVPSRKSIRVARVTNSSKKSEHNNYNNYIDDRHQNNNDNGAGESLMKTMRSEVLCKLLAFKYCMEFKNIVFDRLRILKLMGNWGTHTRAVILVQRHFRRKILLMRIRSAEKIHKFIAQWLYKSQRSLKRKSAILIRRFLTDILEQASIIFAVKKFQYKVRKCQKFVRSYLDCLHARLFCFRKMLDRFEKGAVAALCDEYSEVKDALKKEIFRVFKWFQSECLQKREDWKIKAKNKLLSWNMLIDENDVRQYLISADDADPQFVKKKDKEDPYPSMLTIYSSRVLKTKLLEALTSAKASIVIVQAPVAKKKAKKKLVPENNFEDDTPQELLLKVERFLNNLKHGGH